MRKMTTDELLEQLLVEVTAQRLVTRAIIGHIVANSPKAIPALIADFEEQMAKTSPDLLRLPDVDSDLQEKASLLAKARAAALLSNLSALVAPPRARKVPHVA
jgi:hypothetical protein